MPMVPTTIQSYDSRSVASGTVGFPFVGGGLWRVDDADVI